MWGRLGKATTDKKIAKILAWQLKSQNKQLLDLDVNSSLAQNNMNKTDDLQSWP